MGDLGEISKALQREMAIARRHASLGGKAVHHTVSQEPMPKAPMPKAPMPKTPMEQAPTIQLANASPCESQSVESGPVKAREICVDTFLIPIP